MRFSALQRAEIAEISLSNDQNSTRPRFSALQRAEIAEISDPPPDVDRTRDGVSVLFNEPKLLKACSSRFSARPRPVSVLFNEPKLLKSLPVAHRCETYVRFSALQRAEIAEIVAAGREQRQQRRFSALQRAEIAEIEPFLTELFTAHRFQCSSTSRNC